jgi:hypothetical protein
MRDAGRCAGRYSAAERMRERVYKFSAHRTGRTHRIVLTVIYTVTQPAENKN